MSNQETLAKIYKEDEIKTYLDSSRTPQEIFIYAHGSEHFEKNLLSQLRLGLFQENNTCNLPEQLAHNVLTKIAKNTIGNCPNIVHILSCHSGAAQHNLKDVEGNVVLCTYIPATNITRGGINNLLFNKNYNSENLIDFIVKNLPLLTAIGFSISYKLDNNIHTLAFDHKTIKTMDMNSFSEFLQEQYQKVKEFYKELKEHFSQELLNSELSPDYDFLEKTYVSDELEEAFSTILNLYHESLSNHEMLTLLNMINKADLKCFFYDLISENGCEIILLAETILNKMKDAPSLYISHAIKSQAPFVVETLFNKAGQIRDIGLNRYLGEAIETGDLRIIKMIVDKISIINKNHLDLAFNCPFGITLKNQIIELISSKIDNISDLMSIKVIESCNLPNIKMVLNSKKKIAHKELESALKTKNSEVIDLVYSKYNGSFNAALCYVIREKVQTSFIDELINKNKISILKIFLALEENNLEILPKLFAKINVNNIKPEEHERCYDIITKKYDIELAKEAIKYLKQFNITSNITPPELNESTEVSNLENDIMPVIGEESAFGFTPAA